MNFKVGDRVKAITDFNWSRYDKGYAKGDIFTVSEVTDTGNPSFHERPKAGCYSKENFELVASASGAPGSIPGVFGGVGQGLESQAPSETIAWQRYGVEVTIPGMPEPATVKACACNAPLVWYQPFRGERHQICEKCGKS